MSDKPSLLETQAYWDGLAATFDDEPDHGLRQPSVYAAWLARFKKWVPQPNQTILDIGCGTGSLSVMLTKEGHRLTGRDLSPNMIELARQKAIQQKLEIDFSTANAATITLSPERFDVIVCRHLLWSLPNPSAVLTNWAAGLKSSGRMILVEGYWGGAGLHAKDVLATLPNIFELISYEDLTSSPELWGKVVFDERFAIIIKKA